MGVCCVWVVISHFRNGNGETAVQSESGREGEWERERWREGRGIRVHGVVEQASIHQPGEDDMAIGG